MLEDFVYQPLKSRQASKAITPSSYLSQSHPRKLNTLLFCYCVSPACVKAGKKARFLPRPCHIAQPSNENASNRCRASEAVAQNVESITPVTFILVSRSTTRRITGTPSRTDIVAEAQRSIRCLLLYQSGSVRWISSSELASFCCPSPYLGLRVHAGQIHATLEILPDRRHQVQRFQLRLSARSSKSQQRPET